MSSVAGQSIPMATTGSIDYYRSEKYPQFASITINNPAKRNAMTPSMMLQLHDLVKNLAECSHDRYRNLVALIIRGAPTLTHDARRIVPFCAGVDLTHSEIFAPEGGAAMSKVMTDTLQTLSSLPLISIAAIQGPAIGGGSEIAVSCDVRYMAPNIDKAALTGGYIQCVHAKMGIITAWGGLSRLSQILPRSAVLEAFVGMKPIEPEEAMRLGLCSSNFLPLGLTESDPEPLIHTVATMFMDANLLKNMSPEYCTVMNSLKAAVHAAKCQPFEASLAFEHQLFSSLWGSGINKQRLDKQIGMNQKQAAPVVQSQSQTQSQSQSQSQSMNQ